MFSKPVSRGCAQTRRSPPDMKFVAERQMSAFGSLEDAVQGS